MCGINGFTWADERLIQKMNYVTRHRGPDGEGVYVDENISLGHSRLSIIDLSPRGNQPMSSNDGAQWITFNGEIYNYAEIKKELSHKGYAFNSDTDTEAIIDSYIEWGTDCFKRFNGMWAFCLYDKERKKILLARDRFGVKPLYYHIKESKIIFSSMIGAILQHQIETAPDERAIMEYLAFNIEQYDERTFFTGIYSLLPGSFMEFDIETGEHKIVTWYHPVRRDNVDEKYLREVFEQSVKMRTVADVPIASCLSGGIDSTSIVCILDKILDKPFSTFSFIAPGTSVDESKYIAEVGKVTKTQQFFTQITVDDFLSEIMDYIIANEEPITGLSNYALYRVTRLANEHGAKILLDGQGGDELFAGYIYYYGYCYYELLKKFRLFKLLKEVVLYLKNFKNVFPIAMVPFLLLPDRLKYYVWEKLLNKWVNHDLLQKCIGKAMNPLWKAMTLDEALHMTIFRTSIPRQLMWNDKNSMRFGIEVRVPFLDYNVVETALSLPSDTKLKNGRTKVIFKDAMKEILPEMIYNRKDKIGFAPPENEFFRNKKIVEFCRKIIYSDSFKSRPYWNWNKVAEMFNAHVSGKKNYGREIWKWINLELWIREYFEEKK